MRDLRFFLFPVIASLCLSCAAPVPRQPEAALERLWHSHSASHSSLTRWSLRGRLAVRTESQGGQASISWQRDPDRQTIRLNGPLGRGVVRVTQDESGAHLTDASGNTGDAADATELLLRFTGWELPMASLDWWVRGLPVPDVAMWRELNDEGRLARLRQQGWEVEFSHYAPIDSSLVLPDRIVLRHDPGSRSTTLEVRLVIDRWEGLK
ncbi:MAG: lipoprotein insertase outer membrane protein LolB [Gammaproteobacteria bacterium]|nr:lipoprotein insertase outer membrane protein LolB [Gammaproteobacteria bacterium]